LRSLERRIQKLETNLGDRSRLRRSSPEWQSYWEQKLAEIANGDEPGESGYIPLEVWDALALDEN
jgi:hypothetical protein